MKTAIILLVIVLCLLSTAYRPAVAEQRYTLYAPLVMSSGQMSSVYLVETTCEAEK